MRNTPKEHLRDLQTKLLQNGRLFLNERLSMLKVIRIRLTTILWKRVPVTGRCDELA